MRKYWIMHIIFWPGYELLLELRKKALAHLFIGEWSDKREFVILVQKNNNKISQLLSSI